MNTAINSVILHITVNDRVSGRVGDGLYFILVRTYTLSFTNCVYWCTKLGTRGEVPYFLGKKGNEETKILPGYANTAVSDHRSNHKKHDIRRSVFRH